MNPWSIFWRQGHSTTFGDWFKQGYDGTVADWWRTQLEDLPAPLTMVELGCGNCSLLPAMVKSLASGQYIGVDLAQVSASTVAEQGLDDSTIELVLHSQTPAEEVPEPDSSVDLVASVFGIEYSDTERSIPEVARLLRKGGSFAALLHHDASIVTTKSKQSIAEFDSRDFAKAIEALALISSERDRFSDLAQLKHSHEAEKGRQCINVLAEKYLSDTNPATVNKTMFEFMSQALKFFKMMGASSAQRADFIKSIETEHRASQERFRQMVSVALDAGGMEDFQEKFRQAGFEQVLVDVVKTGKDVLGWSFQATKK